MSDPLVGQLRKLILARTGLRTREHDDASLRRLLQDRARQQSVRDLASYTCLLEADLPESKAEWQELVVLLTTGESFFFRDGGQMYILRTHLLPELIGRRRKTQVLRLWSAGCSTGEEPYSLAILLRELLPAYKQWGLTILGTDLNERALAQARQAQYREWSLRKAPPSLRERYFTQQNGAWVLQDEIRSMVSFRPANLLDDSRAGVFGLANMDLIVCRNVFIYFSREVISKVLRRLEAALTDDGYLVVGHGELLGQDLGRFEPRAFANSVVYQRARRPGARLFLGAANEAGGSASVPTSQPPSTPPRSRPASDAPGAPTGDPPQADRAEALTELRALLAAGDSRAAAAAAERLLEQGGEDSQVLCLAAEAYGNMAQRDQAEAHCRRAVTAAPLAARPHYLLAQLAQERGDADAAKALLKTVLYLEAKHLPAYLELGDLHAREGNEGRARSMWAAALDLLRNLPADAEPEGCRGSTAAELAAYASSRLSTPSPGNQG
ncbi:MAG: hypothetical protein GW802_21455 [Armatimonadetes bacterium]|nr:hypothetical protein [Armatimonadota bacterium]